MAIRTLAHLKHAMPDAVLTMAGEEKGSLRTVRTLASSIGVESSVRFVGFLNDSVKPEMFNLHDIFLNTNIIDNMPISVLEAAAFGLPVISTDVGGIPQMLEHEQTGLLVPSDDHEAMASAILRLLREPVLAERLSRNGRIMAEASSWDRVYPLWRKAFEDAMARNGGT
jgi:glycosyltransferase involved in cell wall biosynthesis